MLESQPQVEHATGRYLCPDSSDGMSDAISSDLQVPAGPRAGIY